MDAACKSPIDLTDCSNCRNLCLGPVIFPCGHLICRKCVRQLIVRKGLPAHCSSCHQIIPLVQGETISDIIDNMCKDPVIEKMVYERLRQDWKTSCDLCHETKVTHVCFDCCHYLCNTCSSDHSVREWSYAHKQQTLPTTWTTVEIQSQSDSSCLEALCRSIECCQVAEVTVVDTQTTLSEVEKSLYDQICQLNNSKKDVDKVITSLQKVKVKLTIKQQILDMYAAELAKHDQRLVQTEPFLNRVRQIKKDNIPPFPHLAALEGCIRALGHCGYMTSERPNTQQVNGDDAREVIVVEQMVEINLKKTESETQVTSQTTDKSTLTFKGVDCIKIAIRCTTINTDEGTIRLETIRDPQIIMQSAENIVVAKTDWSNDRIQKLETERREMKAFEEKNKTKIMRLEKDIIRVTRQVEDERRRWTQRIEEERSIARVQVEKKEVRLRKLEDEQNGVIKQLEEKRSRLEEERSRLKSQLDEEKKQREADLKVMNEKHKEEIKNEQIKNKAFEEKTKMMKIEKDIIRVIRQLEDERRRWTQRIEEERRRAKEQLKKCEIRFTQEEEEKKNVLNQLEEERCILTLQLEEERRRLTLLLEEERKRREAELKVMNEKHKEEMNKQRKNVIRFVMRLEGRDRLLFDVLGRVEDGHLSQVVRQLLHDFHIRLLGMDCGLNFLMEVPASLWGEGVQEQVQGVLSDLVPETDRQEVTWSRVTQFDCSHDLRLGEPMLARETDRQDVSWSHVKQLECSHDSDLRLAGTMLAPETATKQSEEDYWIECIRTCYPELQSRTYFLPPFHFNRGLYDVQIVAGNQVLVPKNPQDSDVRDVRALEQVLQCLRVLADDPLRKEVMMVISQLQFGKYLGEPSYAAAAALLPSTSKLPEEFLRHRYDKGDCDILIIHRKLGLLTLEIRSVGGNFSQQKMTKLKQYNVVVKEVIKALNQLNRAEVVLKHLTPDITNTIRITKIIVLPYISSSQLQRAINRTLAEQLLCQCLGVQNVDDAVKLCLLSDQLLEQRMSSDGNDSSYQSLRMWWKHIEMASGPEQLMTSSLYEQLVARFYGPATTIQVHCVTSPHLNIRTLGEAVSETGERVARLVLFPQQVDILNRSPPGAFLSGPPGTGKTIVLIMQGLTWLQRGHDVHVVSTWDESRAATTVIEHQLQERAKTSMAKSSVHRYQFNFRKDGNVETAARRLKSLNEGRQLCVIADEVVRDYDRKTLFTEFCDQLIVQVPGVFIWGASVYHDVRPLCLEEVKLTTPLRSPPVVVREVKSEEIKNKQVHDYTVSNILAPTDGPPIMPILHRDGQSGHTGHWPFDCVECGHEVARILTELDVGRTGGSNGPPPLKYRDVLVVCDYYPSDVKWFGLKTKTASGLVRGLRDRHVPVRVVEKGDEAAIRKTALGVDDVVTMANWRDVEGLERKVVIVERIGGLDLFDFNKLQAMFGCTSQLVVIHW